MRVWIPPGEAKSMIFKVWDTQPGLEREPTWTAKDPSSLLDGNDAEGITGAGLLIWRKRGAADYDANAVHTVYEGDLVAGRPHGFGEQVGPDGSRYLGEWKSGLPDGTGELLLANGDEYRGGFRDGMFHGEGTYTSASGKSYFGRLCCVSGQPFVCGVSCPGNESG